MNNELIVLSGLVVFWCFVFCFVELIICQSISPYRILVYHVLFTNTHIQPAIVSDISVWLIACVPQTNSQLRTLIYDDRICQYNVPLCTSVSFITVSRSVSGVTVYCMCLKYVYTRNTVGYMYTVTALTTVGNMYSGLVQFSHK